MDTGQSKHRLLLVDGDPKSLRVLEVSLKKAGFGVISASNGPQALAAMTGSAPDLIISDTDLDGTDGFELCREIKSKPEWAKIPFLFVSGRKSIEDKIRGLELGVDDYLTKPVYIKEVGIRVRTALQRAERERLESRRDTRTKFSGDLADIGVVDLVQTIDLNRKSGIIHVTDREGRRGAVFFRDGRVIDAEVGRLAGPEAMYRLFSWSEGRFEVEFKPIRRRDVVELPTAAVLMEGMRRLDEWTRLLETLPGLDKVVEVDYRVLADQLAELPDEVNGLLRLCDGSRSLLAVIDHSDYPDLEALTVASSLFAQHILFVREPGGHRESEPSGELARWLAEGQALTGDSAEHIPQPKATVTTTLVGMRADQISLAGEADAGREVRTFTGELTPSPVTSAPRRKPDEATPQAVPTSKNNTLRLSAAPPVLHETAPAGEGGTASEVSTTAPPEPSLPELAATTSSETELSQSPGVTARKSGSLSDTLRGIPIPQEEASSPPAKEDERETGAAADSAPVSPARLTTVGFGTGREQAAEADEPASEADKETDWSGWAQGNPGSEPSQAPEPLASSDVPASSSEETVQTPLASPPEISGEEQPAPARERMRETFVMADRLLPPRRSRVVPIVVSLGFLAAAGLLVLQIRSRESERPTASASPPSTSVSVEQQQARDADGQAVAVAPPAAIPDASPALAVRPEAKPAVRAKEMAQTGKPAEGRAPAATSDTPDSLERCRKLGASGRSKPITILTACQAANQVDPNASDVMVILAQVELDRGNLPEARTWARKALDIKPDLADAYVFLGGAEQEAGNSSEAKTAYKKYLELAPNGRYARELRVVLNSL